MDGLPRTAPAEGGRLDATSDASARYRARLTDEHARVLSDAGIPTSRRVADYTVVFNGMAVELTPAEVSALSHRSDVVRVWKNEERTVSTDTTPTFLGLDGPAGAWATQFGGSKNAGAGSIIGIIDSGIWTDHPSFAPIAAPTDTAFIARKWKGVCDPGAGAQRFVCNNKVIGGRYFNKSSKPNPNELISPSGYNSHGTHVAATAAGQHGVPATLADRPAGTISGMAPGARLVSYKALWATPDGSTARGGIVDTLAAIDQSVADGVDIINYSVSGSASSVTSPEEIAFMNAAHAGVFVATAAGNDGDQGPSTVNHNGPWTTTVAAGTSSRPSEKKITLGNGATHQGSGLGAGAGPAPLVLASDAAAAGVEPTVAATCPLDADQQADGAQPALDPAKTKDKIVVCLRGAVARVAKSEAVKKAGGVGMVLANVKAEETLDPDAHYVPTIHVAATDGDAIRAYAATPGATATIAATSDKPTRAPAVAGFSSYGPAVAGDGDLLKPDILAPGVAVLSASSPATGKGMFDSMQGTSMATPHIAGIAALVLGKHRDWTPMMVKSALMTSALTTDNTGAEIMRGTRAATPLDYGSGQVTPQGAFRPGVVYTSTRRDWIAYACAIGQYQQVGLPEDCPETASDPAALNYPSIAVGNLTYSTTITRTVTNVDGARGRYDVDVTAPTGFTAKARPTHLDIPAGGSASYTITLTRRSAPVDAWAFGDVSLLHQDGRVVRSPIAVKPVALSAPKSVPLTAPAGSKSITVRTGFDGRLTAQPLGLVPGDERVMKASTTVDDGKVSVTYNVPEGTRLLRFATFDTDYPKGVDIDLEIFKDGKKLGESGEATAEESWTTVDPAPGTYTVTAALFSGAPSADVKINGFAVAKPEGNLTVDPTTRDVSKSTTTRVKATWKDLTPGKAYLGAVVFSDGKTTRLTSLPVPKAVTGSPTP